MSLDAMKQALEALEAEAAGWDSVSPVTRDAIIALLAAIEEAKKQEPVGWVECDGVVVWYNRDAAIGRDLYTTPPQLQAQPNQEPVAWMYVNTDGECEQIEYGKNEPMPDDPSVTRLYAAPRQWQGLTDEELAEFSDLKLGAYDLCLEVEAKLREKNT